MDSLRTDADTSAWLSPPDVSVSIVIEWDNPRLSDIGRAQAMYRSLVAQVRRRVARTAPGRRNGAPSVEMRILYDALAIEPGVIEAATAGPDVSLPPGVELQVQATPGFRYYQLKNEGAKRASGDIVVFLDSDVVPESDWLDQLLSSFADPDVQVVGGNSYIDAASVYSRAFALCWFFPLRAADGPLEPASAFFANNVAFRRAIFAAHPFPDEPRFRGQCSTLARTLREQGISIRSNPRARVAHPAPNGVSHFFWRALWEGHDRVVEERLQVTQRSEGFRGSYWRFRANVIGAWRQVWREGPRVGLSPAKAPVAVGIALGYYSFFLLGEILTRLDWRIIRRQFGL